jgi:hypothetical protein
MPCPERAEKSAPRGASNNPAQPFSAGWSNPSTSACILGEPTQAAVQTYPVCLAGGSNDAVQCDYVNVEQCPATASGGLGYCVMNPAYSSNAYASYRGAGKRFD